VKSFLNFTQTEFRNIGNPGFYIMMKLGDWKLMCPEMNAIFDIFHAVYSRFWMPGFDWKIRHFFWQNRYDYFCQFEEELKLQYRKRIAYVSQIVPKNRLLIWNVKDGWKPICEFLDKPVPVIPFPYENKTGDDFVKENIKQTDFMKYNNEIIKKNILKLSVKAAVYCLGPILFYINRKVILKNLIPTE